MTIIRTRKQRIDAMSEEAVVFLGELLLEQVKADEQAYKAKYNHNNSDTEVDWDNTTFGEE